MDKRSRVIFPGVLGNDSLKKTLAADFAAGKSAHAYIIEGARGSGKHTIARMIAASALCEYRQDPEKPLPCGECIPCKKILHASSVDVMTISNGDKATIGIEPIRTMRSTLYLPPNDGDLKFYIIENAHLMTSQAQNALLLSLEEPPRYVMFLLLCEDSTDLLETIKSRAPIIRTERFSPSYIEDYLVRKFSGSADRDKLIRAAHLADGSLGYAEDLYENGNSEMELYEKAEEFAKHLLVSKKSDALSFASKNLPKDRGSLRTLLSLTRLAVRDMIAEKKGADLLFYSATVGTPTFAKKISVKRSLALIEAISMAEKDIAANCSQNTVITSLICNT